MVLCGTKNGSSMASLEEPFEAPVFLRVYPDSNRTILYLAGIFIQTDLDYIQDLYFSFSVS